MPSLPVEPPTLPALWRANMRKVVLLSLLFSLSANAANSVGSGDFPYVSVGGNGQSVASVMPNPPSIVIPSNDTTWFTLYTGLLSVGNGVTYPFKKNGVIYQVTAGKSAYCTSIRHRVGSASGGFQLLSATATFADAATTASLTGPVYQCGAAATYCMAGSTTANTIMNESIMYKFGAATWPGIQASDNTQLYHVALHCHEL